ncbi:MAG: hypothetical protein JO331_00200 [Verrucomicrobia bacterium]|nr:hypothetical protein [Verrucomicrobiota bacterium]
MKKKSMNSVSTSDRLNSAGTSGLLCRLAGTLAVTFVLASCAAYGPFHANTASNPDNSVRGPADGRYKLAFIEFNDQGSELDPSQRAAALDTIHKAPRPVLFLYIHGWQNNAIPAMSAASSTSLMNCRIIPRQLGERLTSSAFISDGEA